MFDLTYSEYDKKHYILDCGPIGLGVTGKITIIYMEEFQLKAMQDLLQTMNEWSWYVDDS